PRELLPFPTRRSSDLIAEANLDRITRDVARYRKLAEQDAIARQTLDYAETDLNNAEAQVASAKAALTTATTNLNRSTIIAPFSGDRKSTRLNSSHVKT